MDFFFVISFPMSEWYAKRNMYKFWTDNQWKISCLFPLLRRRDIDMTLRAEQRKTFHRPWAYPSLCVMKATYFRAAWSKWVGGGAHWAPTSWHTSQGPVPRRWAPHPSGFLKFSYRWAPLAATEGGNILLWGGGGGIATVMALHLNHFTAAALRRKHKNKIRNKVRSWFLRKWTMNFGIMCIKDILFS